MGKEFVWRNTACTECHYTNKTAESDDIVGKLIHYEGKTMCEILLTLFHLVWNIEYIPTSWREGLIVGLFKKGHTKNPGNYRGITLLKEREINYVVGTLIIVCWNT